MYSFVNFASANEFVSLVESQNLRSVYLMEKNISSKQILLEHVPAKCMGLAASEMQWHNMCSNLLIRRDVGNICGAYRCLQYRTEGRSAVLQCELLSSSARAAKQTES